MYTIYIDVPYGFQNNWSSNVLSSVNEGMSKQLNANVKFICNDIAKISEGDLYSVTFDDERDATFWLLKNNFKLVDKAIVEEYLNTHKMPKLGVRIPSWPYIFQK